MKPKKFKRTEMIMYGNEFIESQVVRSNEAADLGKLCTISGRLGPYSEYYFEYEWPSITFDGYPVLNLIELSYTLTSVNENLIKKSMANHKQSIQNTRLRKQHKDMVSSPLPYLIAFEKLASSFGRRLRIGSITNDNVRSFLIYHRRYSMQSDDDNSLIDKC
jgi:hypothetical protein